MARLLPPSFCRRHSGWVSFGITLVVVPFLLAPIHFQQGQTNLLLTPSHAPAASAISLPAAVALATPTVMAVSPSVAAWVSASSPSPTAAVAPPSPVAQAANGPSVLQGQLCERAMATVAQLAVLSYQQQRQQASMNVTIAAAAAGAAASSGQWPNLVPLQQAAHSMSGGSPQRAEVQQAVTLSVSLCAQPGGGNVVPPKQRIVVPRPD